MKYRQASPNAFYLGDTIPVGQFVGTIHEILDGGAHARIRIENPTRFLRFSARAINQARKKIRDGNTSV